MLKICFVNYKLKLYTTNMFCKFQGKEKLFLKTLTRATNQSGLPEAKGFSRTQNFAKYGKSWANWYKLVMLVLTSLEQSEGLNRP